MWFPSMLTVKAHMMNKKNCGGATSQIMHTKMKCWRFYCCSSGMHMMQLIFDPRLTTKTVINITFLRKNESGWLTEDPTKERPGVRENYWLKCCQGNNSEWLGMEGGLQSDKKTCNLFGLRATQSHTQWLHWSSFVEN